MANGPKKACGVLIAVKDSIPFNHIRTIPDSQGRYLILICELNRSTFTLVNLYALNNNQKNFLTPLLNEVAELMQGTLIIGGDFNTILNPDMDSTTPTRSPKQSIAPLSLLHELYDAWRCLHGSEKDFTFMSAAHSSYSRIDFFLTTKASLQNVVRTDIGTIFWSDHAPITLTFDDHLCNSPPPLWRLNTCLLSDRQLYQNIVQEHHDFFYVQRYP